ncbi:MAG: chromosomal replication initiator protein DnaA [Tannerella sp.]|jgi:chromosomal replication initiator protein|nr:chromosomal replication initiator protein DnaA [Tannerella sp.]
MQSNYQSLWSECLAIIRGIVPEAAFNTWFQPIVPLSYDNRKVTIRVPSQFFYEYLEEKYIHVLKTTLFRVFGEDTILNYRVEAGKSHHKDTALDAPPNGRPLSTLTSGTVDTTRTPFTGVAPREFDAQLNAKYTMDTFFEGKSNRLARVAAEEVAGRPGKTLFNPLFIYGPSGVGKTHLCHAIGLRIRELHPETKVLYVSANVFRIQYTDAVRKNTTNDFLNFYQSLDTLILDDIHEFIGKQQTQNTFFHIFNNLHQLGKQLVMTSDKAPVNMQGMEERLITRLKWGLTTEIDRPDKELRKKILQKKLDTEGIVFKDEVFEYIATHVTENVRDLEGTLVSLVALSLIENREIDIALARQVISKTVRSPKRESLSVEKVLTTVCNFLHISQELIQTSSQKREIAQVRQISMYLSKKHTQASLSHIGKIIGGKNHATVLYSIRTVENQIETDKKFRSMIETLEDSLKKVS